MTPSVAKSHDVSSGLHSVDILVCLILPILSVFSEFFSEYTGINMGLITLFIVVLALLASLRRGWRQAPMNVPLLFGAIAVGFLGLHSLTVGSSLPTAFKPMLLVMLVMFAGPSISVSGERLFFGTVVAMSLVITANAFMNMGQYSAEGLGLYNVRQSTIVDKPSFTLLYALSITILIINLKSIHGKLSKVLALLTVALEAYVGLAIIESKTFLVAVVVALVLYYVTTSRERKPNVLVPLLMVAAIIIGILFLSDHPGFIPDSVRSVLSNVFGMKISYSERYEGTYVGRSSITAAALSQFALHPIAGLGFGNFTTDFIWNNTVYTVTQAESSWLDFLVEGGAVYFLFQLCINVWLISKLYRLARSGRGELTTTVFLTLVIFATLNLFNDHATNIYWCTLAIGYGEICRFTLLHSDGLLPQSTRTKPSVLSERRSLSGTNQ